MTPPNRETLEMALDWLERFADNAGITDDWIHITHMQEDNTYEARVGNLHLAGAPTKQAAILAMIRYLASCEVVRQRAAA